MIRKQAERVAEGRSFAEQLEHELDAIVAGRKSAEVENRRTARSQEDSVDRAHDANLLGLALSGGGIRSATFNLGVIQGLAKLRLLHDIDYLSTVSGGGYIGAWLSAWVYRERDAQGKSAPSGILAVEERLRASVSERPPENPMAPKEPPQVGWLRRFSNYLTPSVGVLSTDTLTGVATYLRNLLLNQTVLVLFGSSLLVLPWFLVAFAQRIDQDWMFWSIAGLALVALLVGSGLAGYETLLADRAETELSTPSKGDDSAGQGQDRGPDESRKRYWILFACFALVAVLVGVSITLWPQGVPALCLLGLGVAGYGIGTLSGIVGAWHRAKEENRPSLGIHLLRHGWALVAGAVFGGMLIAWTKLVSGPLDQLASALPAVVVGPLAVLAVLLLTVTLHLGLVSRGIREAARELWSRHGAHQLRFGIGWLAITGAALFGPLLLMWADGWVTSLGGATWVLTTLGGVVAGASDKTGGRGENRMAKFFAAIAPYVFVAGLLLILSFAVHESMWRQLSGEDGWSKEHLCKAEPEPGKALYALMASIDGKKAEGSVVESPAAPSCDFAWYAKKNAEAFRDDTLILLGLAPFLFLLSLGLSRRVDINVFGFHMFYRNRIERCYLGASNPDRQPHPFTGLDPMDSPRLADLTSSGTPDLAQRPFPIVNTALNITKSRNLAWQERKAASFTFTPMYCGYELEEPDPEARYGRRLRSCYQPTGDYLKEVGKKVSFAVPVAISGAAASPNAGYHTSGATAFLMTVFNVRLGWWLQNPRYGEQWHKPGPKLALFLLLQELAGRTSDESRYVYLSDGGHFENLGVYELVRRRCRYVIACDAGCDPEYSFEDLGNLVRKCQIDLGIDIEIDPRPIRPDSDTGRSIFHCAVGRIHYERVDPNGEPGYLLYIKASLTGDEPTDVLQYAGQNPGFPHQTTADQWYSESQFESYRKLGIHQLDAVMSAAVDIARARSRQSQPDLEEIFAALSERWYPPSARAQASFSKHGEAVEAIFELIRKDENLRFLDEQIYPEWCYLLDDHPPGWQPRIPPMLPDKPAEVRAGFYVCNSLIQHMENLYHDLDLEQEHDHPNNRGWMNLFRHWSWAGMFRVTWAISASTYGARFQSFCERRLDLGLGDVTLGVEVPVRNIEDLPLNFVEKEHVQAVIAGLRLQGDCVQLMVVPLSLDVMDPSMQRREIGFPIAFALIVQYGGGRKLLVYYRVRDHLRVMGLGRKGLAILREKGAVSALAELDRDIQARIAKEIPEADYRTLRRMWMSVAMAMDSRTDKGDRPSVRA
jgi:hypothetical protein